MGGVLTEWYAGRHAVGVDPICWLVQSGSLGHVCMLEQVADGARARVQTDLLHSTNKFVAFYKLRKACLFLGHANMFRSC